MRARRRLRRRCGRRAAEDAPLSLRRPAAARRGCGDQRLVGHFNSNRPRERPIGRWNGHCNRRWRIAQTTLSGTAGSRLRRRRVRAIREAPSARCHRRSQMKGFAMLRPIPRSCRLRLVQSARLLLSTLRGCGTPVVLVSKRSGAAVCVLHEGPLRACPPKMAEVLLQPFGSFRRLAHCSRLDV
jgi:hypothetical protein